MVENIFEELDAPGEWFHNATANTLYFKPDGLPDTRVVDGGGFVSPSDSTLYPDFWVSTLCRDPVNEQRVAYPGLVIEVLSPFREKVDRGAKLHAYREIDSVQELLVIDPARGRSELYRRCGPRQWQFTDVDGSEPIHLSSIEMSLEGFLGFGYR